MTWIVAKLADVATIERDQIEPSAIPAGTQYLGLEHIEAGGRIIESKSVSRGELASAKFKFSRDHILYGKLRPYLAKIALPDFSGICSTDILPVRPGPQVDREYLAYFFRQPQMVAYADLRTTGANLPRLSPRALADFDVPLPPLAEQRRIAAILDKANAIRSKREQVLSLTESFLKSSFLQTFGDPLDNPHGFSRERIGDCLSKTRAGTQSGPFGSALKKHEYTDHGVPVWGVENVHPNRFKGEPRLFISNDKYDHLRRYNVVRGDVLISRAGTVGRMCVARPDCAKSIISTNLVRVSLDASILLPEYLVCMFTYFGDRLSALKANNKNDAFTFLNPKTLREIVIPVPEMARQQNFVRLVRKLDGLLARLQDQRNGLSDLFSSLSQRAFRGEL